MFAADAWLFAWVVITSAILFPWTSWRKGESAGAWVCPAEAWAATIEAACASFRALVACAPQRAASWRSASASFGFAAVYFWRTATAAAVWPAAWREFV